MMYTKHFIAYYKITASLLLITASSTSCTMLEAGTC